MTRRLIVEIMVLKQYPLGQMIGIVHAPFNWAELGLEMIGLKMLASKLCADKILFGKITTKFFIVMDRNIPNSRFSQKYFARKNLSRLGTVSSGRLRNIRSEGFIYIPQDCCRLIH